MAPDSGRETALPAFAGTRRFRPLAEIGRGAMGVVYRVADDETQTEVALKTFAARDPDLLYRLKQEFRVLADIAHPNLVELYELFVEDDESFFTMELIDGVGFGDYARATNAPDALHEAGLPAGLLDAARQLVTGLAAVHAAGKLHRDIKPSNVLVSANGRVVILDFGLATVFRVGAPDPEASVAAGTIAYMAPDQVWGRPATAASDWYSVGVMLYEAAAGCLPFEGTAARVMTAKGQGPPPPLRAKAPALPERFDQLVTALLQPDPDRRPDGDAILAVIDSFQGDMALPRRAPASRATGVHLVGRDEELAVLRSSFEQIRRGVPATVHVRGPSGIGKSELVRRFLQEIEAGGHDWVLAGRCHPQEAVPYKAFDSLIDALTRKLLALSDTELRSLVPDDAGALRRLFPVLGRIPALAAVSGAEETAEPYEVRRRGFAALRALLGRLAASRPLVLWIDDLQWTDDDSAVLLRDLCRPPEAPPLLLVLSYRDESDNPLLAAVVAVQTAPPAAHIALGALDTEDTLALARLLCPLQSEREQRLAEIVAESAGSPFLVAELARHVSAGAPSGGAPSASARLAEAITARVDHLPAPSRRLLEIVSLAGTPLDRTFALGVAGVGERGRPLVTALSHASLLRPLTLRDRPAVEVYHDRVGEALVASLSLEERRARHGELADAFRAQPEPDPDALFRHCLGAERREQAAEWAVQAGARAAGALAFVRAADLYGQALQLKQWDGDHAANLETECANALVNAGHGSAAAPLYLAAATRRHGGAALDLRRRAAEQYLVSGHIDAGVAELRALLSDLGLPYPRSPGRATLALAARLLQLWVRGTTFSERREADVDPSILLSVDACNAAAKGLVQVDPIRGTYYSVLTLLLALRAGETTRIGLDLCLGGSALVVAGGPMTKWGLHMLELAREIGRRTRDARLLGSSAITSGVVDILNGRWHDVLRLCDEGGQILRDQCRGVTWERDIGRMAAIRALEEIGDVPEVLRRSQELRREAEDTGDLYAQLTARQYAAYWRLAADDAAGARAEARAALALWTHTGYHLQHFYALRIEAHCDIYENDAAAAFARVNEAWPALRRSNLLRHPVVRVDADLLFARVGMAAATREGDDGRYLRQAERHARALAAQKRPDAVAHGMLIQAGIAAARGERAQAMALLADAADRFARHGVVLGAAYTRRRRGELIGGDEGTEVIREATEIMTQRTIGNPSRWLAVHAPGFSTDQARRPDRL